MTKNVVVDDVEVDEGMAPVIAAARSQMPVNEQAQPAQQETNDKGKAFIKPLTGLRFVAAMLVVMYHLFHANVSGGGHGVGHLLKRMVYNLTSAGGESEAYIPPLRTRGQREAPMALLRPSWPGTVSLG